MRLFIYDGRGAVAALDIRGPVVTVDDFKEAEHPRVRKGSHGGEFTSKGSEGGTGSTSTAKIRGKPVTISKASQRAFTGIQKMTRTQMSKQEAGALGENVAVAYMKSAGYKDSGPVNTEIKNFPVDLIQDHELIEVKTGLVSNGERAQQWRATIGQPGRAETAWLRKATPKQKAKFNAKKKKEIIARKEKVIREFSQRAGKKFKGKTVTLILDLDTNTADVFVFDGFHSRIGWSSPEAEKAYVGSYKWR